jgi:small ubiquitin-related modifier
MGKVFNAYVQKKGLDLTAVRFLLDGDRIDEQATPKTLELEDDDQIDCVLEQLGGL